MLDLKQYFEFEKSFIQYLKSGNYPSNLSNTEELKIFIKTQLSLQQQAQLRMAIFQNVDLIDDWQLIGPVLKTLGNSVQEGILGGIVAGLATYNATEDLYTSLRNGCATGLFWVFGRTTCANHSIKSHYAKSKERTTEFSDVLPSEDEANEIISQSLQRGSNQLSAPVVGNAQRRLPTLAQMITAKRIGN